MKLSLGQRMLAVALVAYVVADILLIPPARLETRNPAIVAGVLFLPAPLTEVTGHFSSLRPPAAIATIEVVQTLLALMIVGISVWLLRRPVRIQPGASGRGI